MTDANDVAVTATEDLSVPHAIRRSVFIEEQGVSPAVEFDDKDAQAHHYVASVDGEPAGTARVRFLDDETARVERVAVLPDYRGRGVGEELMRATHTYAFERGRTRALVHAQERVADFYESLGYEVRGPVSDETDIPHVEMVAELG